MSHLILEHSSRVRGEDGTEYRVITYGERRDDGTWEAWLEFEPSTAGAVLRTDQETSQPDRKAVEYWAGGLEPVYLEGALARAHRVRTSGRRVNRRAD